MPRGTGRMLVSILKDDKDGNLKCRPGEVLKKRYTVGQTLGQGTFGKVLEFEDQKSGGAHVALKIIKNKKGYKKEALLEIKVLKKISKLDPDNASLCVKMNDSFLYNRHMCLSFQLLASDTLTYLPYSISQIQHMGYQICVAVKFLHHHNLTHTDLKPENIVFIHPEFSQSINGKRTVKSTAVQLIDFGSATSCGKFNDTIVSTQQYRATEVILGENDCELLSLKTPNTRRTRAVGSTNHRFLGGNQFKDKQLGLHDLELFVARGCVLSVETSTAQHPHPDSSCGITRGRVIEGHYVPHPESGYIPTRWMPGELHLPEGDDMYTVQYLDEYTYKGYMQSEAREVRQVFDLKKKMLRFDLAKRLTLADALEHPFFSKGKAEWQKAAKVRKEAAKRDQRAQRARDRAATAARYAAPVLL